MGAWQLTQLLGIGAAVLLTLAACRRPCDDGFGRAGDGNCYPIQGSDTDDTGEVGDTADTGEGDTYDPMAIPDNGLYVRVTWEVALNPDWEADLDLHVVDELRGWWEDEHDCYAHGQPSCIEGLMDWGVIGSTSDNPSLNQDSIDLGPEVITVEQPAPNRYYVLVSYPGSGSSPVVILEILVAYDGIVLHNSQRAIEPTMDAIGYIDFPGATFVVDPWLGEAR